MADSTPAAADSSEKPSPAAADPAAPGSPQPADIQLLRHAVATLAYRCAKSLRGAPAEFDRFEAAPGARTPGQILAHIGDLLDWALAMAQGRRHWQDSAPLPWEEEKARCFAALEAFDRQLAVAGLPGSPATKLFQGPVADALTHVGQLSLLRRLAGAPHRGENYYAAAITTGRAGADQQDPVREFG
jgi:hypothetical protein